MTPKKVKCLNCKHYDGRDCHKNGNIGILIKYRNQSRVYLQTPEELNKDGKCKSYGRIQHK